MLNTELKQNIKIEDDSILNYIRKSNYTTVNNVLSGALGCIETNIYCYLLAKYEYYKHHNLLKSNMFYVTNDEFEDIGIKKTECLTAINFLKKIKLIKTDVLKLSNDNSKKRYFEILNSMTLIHKIFEIENKYNEIFEDIKNTPPEQLKSENKTVSDLKKIARKEKKLELKELFEKAENDTLDIDNTSLCRNRNNDNQKPAYNKINNKIKYNNINNKSVYDKSNKQKDKKDMTEYNISFTENELKEKYNYTKLKDKYGNITDDVFTCLFEMYNINKIYIKNTVYDKKLIHNSLNKLTYDHLVNILFKIKTISTTIHHKKNYILTLIYNEPFEYNVSQISNTNKQADKVPQYKDFNQRKYDKEFFDSLYKNINK